MRTWFLYVICIAAPSLWLSGCWMPVFDLPAPVLSLYAICEPDSVDFEPALLGPWSDGDVTWHFRDLSESGVRLYRLVISSSDAQDSCQARLVDIDGAKFLDLYPDGCSSVPRSLPWFPVHGIAHIQQLQPTLELRFMGQDWLQTYLRDRPHAINHVAVRLGDDNHVLLSAPTEVLREFFCERVNADDAWFGLELHRMVDTAQADTTSISAPSRQSGIAVDPYLGPFHHLIRTRALHRGKHTQLISVYSRGDGSKARRVFYDPYSLCDYNGDGRVDRIGYPLDFDGEITRAQADSLFDYAITGP